MKTPEYFIVSRKNRSKTIFLV